MKFIVAQIGARRGYAIPAILEKAGMLERFYTDITGDLDLGKVLSTGAMLPFPDNPAPRLAERRLPPNIRAKTTTFPGLSLGHVLRRFANRRGPAADFREWMRFSTPLGRASTRWGFVAATQM